MGNIKVMSDDLSNKIAAGEVVERPLSVVKELVENSIDAHSSKIYITLKNSGIDYINVVDDGCGMDKADALLCFDRHTSSKLTNEEMLFKIATLGFRGEALSSIAAVSKVVLETCDGVDSTLLEVEYGKITKESSTAFRSGSSFIVTNLFHNTPARLKYINNLYSELAKIISYVSKCALANPGISFKLMNDGKEIISTAGSDNMLKTVRDIYTIEISKKLVELECSNEDTKVTMYAAKPDFQRSNKNYINVFVNKRVVNCPTIIKAVIEQYSKYMPRNRYPFCIINITIDPQLIDVNIHPNKYEIKFSKHQEVVALIAREVEQFLSNENHIVDVKREAVKVEETSQQEIKLERSDAVEQLFQSYLDKPKNNDTIVSESSEDNYEVVRNVEVGSDSPINNEVPIVEEKPEPIQNSRYYEPIGQFSGTYILAQSSDELILIDQHAAVERINYEKNQKLIQNQTYAVTDLLVPLTFTFSKSEALLISDNLQKLEDLQIDVSEFGDTDFAVRAIPSWIETGSENEMLEMIFERLLNNESIAILDLKDDAIELMSCKESLKANSKLSTQEMEYIIDNIFKCDNPYHCPHGRPVIVKLTLKEIEKMFKRVM